MNGCLHATGYASLTSARSWVKNALTYCFTRDSIPPLIYTKPGYSEGCVLDAWTISDYAGRYETRWKDAWGCLTTAEYFYAYEDGLYAYLLGV
ncbi:hypothetical protein M413DRAFT_446863 [Hebeloma cylindrosporum]|uniref:Uncharacterized protein n=1 Tax=Hebeloma cylindrosporum TaxID=76867 RepID=A0A0C3BTF5_HEBCY|nr:hypothetical protein M413DRAFT_446863 [Hebeloma cylindrosporum h7]